MAAIKAGSFAFSSLSNLAGWKTIVGLQFENLVVSHYREFLPRLNLGSALITSAAPYRKSGEAGVQIDLLLQMANCSYIIEVKHQSKIGVTIETEIEKKLRRLPTRGRKSVRTALIYCGDLDPSVAERGFFDALIPIEDIF